jgi:spermidine synthase
MGDVARDAEGGREVGREVAAAYGPRRVPLLFLNVVIIAVCGLVYELLAATVSSYLLGDSVTQFSLVIGVYLTSMGLGAWISRYINMRVARGFCEVQLLIALIGGTSAPVLFFVFGMTGKVAVVLYLEVMVIGALVGLELPLLMRLLEKDLQFKDLISRVLALDYVGALFASLLFPLVFVPMLGLVRTALLMGFVNAVVGLWATSLLRFELRPSARASLRVRGVILAVALAVGVIKAEALTEMAEERVFRDPIVYAESTPYQRIVVTSAHESFQVYLNGQLQLDASDEYRYHEALVHPAVAALGRPLRRALVLGGGDGLALRELFRYPQIEAVTLVDLDPGMTSLSRRFEPLAALNRRSYEDGRLTVVNEDAFLWVDGEAKDGREAAWDLVVVDFPDPNNYGLGKLYTRHFYQRLRALVAPGGRVVVQSTSPLAVNRSYWTIIATLEAAGFVVHPMQVTVPSFGVWGFGLAGVGDFAAPRELGAPEAGGRFVPEGLRFVDSEVMRGMFVLPRDMARVEVEVNRLDNQILVRRYEAEGERWR